MALRRADQHRAHFGAGEHYGEASGCASSDDGRQRREGRGEDRAVEEEECTQSLVLGGAADLAIGARDDRNRPTVSGPSSRGWRFPLKTMKRRTQRQ
jgi:hypothetical protein